MYLKKKVLWFFKYKMFALSRLYRKAQFVIASYPKFAYAQNRPWGPFLDGKSQYLFTGRKWKCAS